MIAKTCGTAVGPYGLSQTGGEPLEDVRHMDGQTLVRLRRPYPHLMSDVTLCRIERRRDERSVYAASQYQIAHGKVADQSGKDCDIKENHAACVKTRQNAFDYRGQWYGHPQDDHGNPEQGRPSARNHVPDRDLTGCRRVPHAHQVYGNEKHET